MLNTNKSIIWVINLINNVIICNKGPLAWGNTRLFPHYTDRADYNTFYFLNTCLYQLLGETMWSDQKCVSQRFDQDVFIMLWSKLEEYYPEIKKKRG